MSSNRVSVNSILTGTNLTIHAARESLQNIRRISEDSYYGLNDENSERTWNYSYLRDQFKIKNLDFMFEKYTRRINHAYFSLFLILLFLLGIIHFCVVLASNLANNSLNAVIFDLVCYSILIVLSAVTLIFNESYLLKNSKFIMTISITVFAIVFLINFLVPLYHFWINFYIIRPAYTTIIIFSCYLFFNINKGYVTFILGSFVSLCEISYLCFVVYGITGDYREDFHMWQKISSDVVFLVCINCLGIYYRVINEIVQRRTFLDRRACVMSTLKLKHEEEQEDQLMSSIIPKNIIEEVKVDIMRTIQVIETSSRLPRQKPFENPYIHVYENVSILYADVVNFTMLTGTLSVTKLVETLNELFGSFDDASEKLNVLRIKFLGDCYYCVAGLPPDPAPNHAEACVDLGLEMIQIIRNVRESSNVGIGMRIGINSGRVLSGLIGLTKWQFDVWSTDVLIANKMESTGEAGKVHITKKTKDLLKKPYLIEPTDKGRVMPELQPFNIETFLISPFEVNVQRDSLRKLSVILDETGDSNSLQQFLANSKLNKSPSYSLLNNRTYSRTPSTLSNGTTDSGSEDYYSSIYSRRESVRKGDAPVERRASGLNSLRLPVAMSERRKNSGDIKRRTAFMNNYIKKYARYLDNTNKSMEMAIKKMPLTKYQQWFNVKDIHPFFLVFQNLSVEMQFIKQGDPLFKYAILMQIFLMLCCTLLQNLTLSTWQSVLVLNYVTLVFLVVVITPVLWSQYLWQEYMSNSNPELLPKFTYLRLIIQVSNRVTSSWIWRSLIYIITTSLCVACVSTELVQCNKYFNEINTTDINEECITPWNMTRAMSVIIIILFLFIKIYVWLKLILVCIFVSFFAYNMWTASYEFFMSSESTNYMVSSNLSHVMITVFFALTLHLVDRQSDYLNRLDYNWNRQLNAEKSQANIKHKINSMLIRNILPIHLKCIWMLIETVKNYFMKNTKM
ncbi:adenylate cyclase type 2-like isoform X2 [Agrilus planipennis]|uniref:adenylate cyclase n=1 Tax=Agrilus planipennis TaxID=224129 RepID=A0A7F5RG51_AGRPL|nr:adenylate cyclase type 2-like isoform X2 [Agrilus planipennis]